MPLAKWCITSRCTGAVSAAVLVSLVNPFSRPGELNLLCGRAILTDDDYEPELDAALLADWCAFCEGSEDFDKYHFSTILMGVFVAGLTREVEAFLLRFTNAFPPVLFENLVRICSPALPDRDVLPWIRRDLNQKIRLLGADFKSARENVEQFLTDDNFTFTEDASSLPDIAGASRNFEAIYFAERDYVIDHCRRKPTMFALEEALYHIATNYVLAHSIMSPIMNGRVDLGNYFEVYLRGGDYVVAADSIVVWQYDPDSRIA